MKNYDYLIVGAGISGIVLAERLALIGKKILLIDKRYHIGGNCYDYYNDAEVLIHKYGPHYFRTKSEEVINYLSQFTEWIYHNYKVKARIKNRLYSFPINKKTLEQFFNKKFNSKREVKDFIESIRNKNILKPKNAEEQVLSLIGKEIYDAFFKEYTKKQWGIKATNLNASVTARIPIRYNNNDNYIIERFQAMPKEGYTKMFEKMLKNKNIMIKLNTFYSEEMKNLAKRTIWSGPIDEYYGFKFGKLPYRSLKFIFIDFYGKEFIQNVGQINYPSKEVPYTRTVEIKHVTHQKSPNTTISIEIPKAKGEPYYPMPTKKGEELYEKYFKESKKEKNVYFLGRLGKYKYLNMDQCVEESLNLFKKIIEKEKTIYSTYLIIAKK